MIIRHHKLCFFLAPYGYNFLSDNDFLCVTYYEFKQKLYILGVDRIFSNILFDVFS